MSQRILETEWAFVSAALLDPRTAMQHVDLPPEAFSDPEARVAYAEIKTQLTTAGTCDSITVSQMTGNRELIGLPTRFSASPSMLPTYHDRIREAHRARCIADACRQTQQALAEGNPTETASRLMAQLTDLTRTAVGWEHSMESLASGAAGRLAEARRLYREGGTIGVPTGMQRLDRGLGGFHPGHLIVVGARPKVGKTAWALSTALAASAAGHPVGIVSAEMPADQLTDRMISAISGVAYVEMRSGRVGDWEAQQANLAAEALARRPVYVMDQPACAIGDVLRQARSWVLQHGIKVLYVDHLLRLRTERDTRRDLELNDMIRALKSLAGELRICVVLLTQLNRGVEARADKRPILSDLRESGAAEEEADAVLMLYRESVYSDDADERSAEMIIEANRHGPAGTIPMRWLGERMLWIDPELEDVPMGVAA